MKNGVAAKQYASAIYQISAEQGAIEEIMGQLQTIATLLKESDQVRLFWQHPQIKPAAKIEAVKELTKMEFLPTTEKFIALLLRKGRNDILDEILVDFRKLQLEEQGVLVVKVSTAQPLQEEEEKNLLAKLQEEHQKEILLEKEVLPHLLGGIRIQIEDTVYDSTIRRRLDKMREVLLPQFR